MRRNISALKTFVKVWEIIIYNKPWEELRNTTQRLSKDLNENIYKVMVKYICIIITVAAHLCSIPEVYALPTGAPVEACTSLTPDHFGDTTGGVGIAPFTITLQGQKPNELQVTISSSDDTEFKGVILQARRVGTTTAIGTFSNLPANTQTIQCNSANVSCSLKFTV